jgi:hypothetical protein
MAKWSTFTQSNKCAYLLPEGKRVLGVAYAQQVYMQELGMFFVNSHYAPMWKVSHATRTPRSIDEAKELLQTAYSILGTSMWLAVDSTLVIWPPALNDGDVLIVEVEDASD